MEEKNIKKPAKKNSVLPTILLIIIVIVGLGIMFYPMISNYVNSLSATTAIVRYSAQLGRFSVEEYNAFMSEAEKYNDDLYQSGSFGYALTKAMTSRYDKLLNINGNGIMGYIEIEKLDIKYPVYHGVSEAVLQTAIGHVEWSSLPIPGESVHSVLSGHRGLPKAKLFTDLVLLEVGDTFKITVLNKELIYQVDQITTVLPTELDELKIVEGENYCTLVTCTPYGINSHRYLVRGKLIEVNDVQTTAQLQATQPQ